MRCKYCRNRFDGRKHHCPRCGKHRHYRGPAQRRSIHLTTALVTTMLCALPLGAYEAGRKVGHAEAKEKLEELE